MTVAHTCKTRLAGTHAKGNDLFTESASPNPGTCAPPVEKVLSFFLIFPFPPESVYFLYSPRGCASLSSSSDPVRAKKRVKKIGFAPPPRVPFSTVIYFSFTWISPLPFSPFPLPRVLLLFTLLSFFIKDCSALEFPLFLDFSSAPFLRACSLIYLVELSFYPLWISFKSQVFVAQVRLILWISCFASSKSVPWKRSECEREDLSAIEIFSEKSSLRRKERFLTAEDRRDEWEPMIFSGYF